MGLFSSSTKIYVSSVVYNLNGDDYDPAWFAPSTILTHVLQNTPSIAEDITNGLLAGSGMKYRKFFNWMIRSGYADAVGLATSTYYDTNDISNEELINAITANLTTPLVENQSIVIDDWYIGEYNEYRFADQWIQQNRPDLWGTNYEVEITRTIAYRGTSYTDSDRKKHTTLRKYNYFITITDTNGTKLGDIKISEWISRTENITYIDTNNRYLYIRYAIHTFDPITLTATDQWFYLIYGYKTGNAIYDALFKTAVPYERSYAPYIPVRIWNQMVPDVSSELYNWCKKASKRIFDGKTYDQLLEQVEDNPSIGDIDFTYVHFGVAINTPFQVGKKYIFQFIKNLYEAFGDKTVNLIDPEDPYNELIDKYPSFLVRLINNNDRQVWVKSNNSTYNINFDIGIGWDTMTTGSMTGIHSPSGKVDEYWFDRYTRTREYTVTVEEGGDNGGTHTETRTKTIYYTRFNHQVTANRVEYYVVSQLAYANKIYKGRSVSYRAYNEILKTDEDSGFIFPLQINTFKDISMVDSTDLAQFCGYLIFNCYEKVKKKWYQSGFFGFIITVIVVIVTIYFTAGTTTGPAVAGSTAATSGVTSAATTIGTSLGLSGMVATIVGGAILMAASALVTVAITKVVTAVLGDSLFAQILGTVLATVASVYTGMAMTNFAQSGTFMTSTATLWGEMCSASGLLKLGIASLNTYTNYLNTSMQEMQQDALKFSQTYEQQLEKINQAYAELFGSTSNAGLVTNAMLHQYEPMDTFLTRTLLTGSDIAQMSLDMVSNFVDYTLNLDIAK